MEHIMPTFDILPCFYRTIHAMDIPLGEGHMIQDGGIEVCQMYNFKERISIALELTSENTACTP